MKIYKFISLVAIVLSIICITITMDQQLKYPLDTVTQSILGKFLKENLPNYAMDSSWDDYLHYTTFFESIAGYQSSGVAFSGGDLEFTIPNTLGSEAYIMKNPSVNPFLTFNKNMYFRTSILPETGLFQA